MEKNVMFCFIFNDSKLRFMSLCKVFKVHQKSNKTHITQCQKCIYEYLCDTDEETRSNR